MGEHAGIAEGQEKLAAGVSFGEGAPLPRAFLDASFSLTLPISPSLSQKCLRLEGRQLNRAYCKNPGDPALGSLSSHTHTHRTLG